MMMQHVILISLFKNSTCWHEYHIFQFLVPPSATTTSHLLNGWGWGERNKQKKLSCHADNRNHVI
uniref:Uncharacterized protein n=1 Tax=Octopus bimaculoides TaxID=37653 RepID=A0A0L8GY38_OCTBM